MAKDTFTFQDMELTHAEDWRENVWRFDGAKAGIEYIWPEEIKVHRFGNDSPLLFESFEGKEAVYSQKGSIVKVHVYVR